MWSFRIQNVWSVLMRTKAAEEWTSMKLHTENLLPSLNVENVETGSFFPRYEKGIKLLRHVSFLLAHKNEVCNVDSEDS